MANSRRVNYAKLDYYRSHHHERFKTFVEAQGLHCQACCGYGGHTMDVYFGSGPFEECYFCEGTGKTTPHLLGLYLNMKKRDQRALGVTGCPAR